MRIVSDAWNTYLLLRSLNMTWQKRESAAFKSLDDSTLEVKSLRPFLNLEFLQQIYCDNQDK